MQHLSSYLINLTLPSIHMVPVAPSLLAASAIFVSRRVLVADEPVTWSQALAFYTGYEQGELTFAVRMMAKMLLRAPVSKYQVERS